MSNWFGAVATSLLRSLIPKELAMTKTTLSGRHPGFRLCVIVAFMVLAGPAAFAQETVPHEAEGLRLRLKDAIRMAEENHLDAVVAEKLVEQASARVWQASAPLFPQLRAAASQSRQTKNLDAAGISLAKTDPVVGPFNSLDARFKITQVLFDAAMIERFRSATAGKHLSMAQARQEKEDAMALVGALFLEAVRGEDKVKLAEALLERDSARLGVMKRQFEVGTGSSIDLERANAALSVSEHNREKALADAASKRLDLLTALGLPPDATVELIRENPEEIPAEFSSEEIFRAAQEHPKVVASEYSVKQKRMERWAEMTEFAPKVSGFADWGISGKTLSESEETYTVGAELSVPVFEGGLKVSRLREAASKLRESEARRDDARRRAESDIHKEIEWMKEAAALVRSAKQFLEVAKKQLVLAEHRLKTGLGSDLEVTEASADRVLASDDEQEAQAAFQIAQINLMHALGRMEQFAMERETL